MSPPDGSTILTLNATPGVEGRMRTALGLAPEPLRQGRSPEHKPPRSEGSVASTRRTSETFESLRARFATMAGELKTERSERVAAQQALTDVQRTIQQLQTKLAHTEMAATEALQIERQARLSAEAKLSQIVPAKPPKLEAPKSSEPKRRGRPLDKPRVAKEPEQKPVEWWLPSYKAKQAKRTRSKT